MSMIVSGSSGLQFPDASNQGTAFTGNAATITSGTVATARLGSGTADSTTYLRGDQTWSTVTQTRISGGTTGLTPSTLTGGDVTLAGTLAVANGGTGTASPSLVAGTGISISGSFPNQTVTNTVTSAYVGGRGQVFTANGTFTIPTGVTALKVTVVGGGGGGPVGGNFGGGGGATAIKWLTGLTAGNTLAVTIGAGGAGKVSTGSQASGNAGGNSTVASGTQTITTITGGGAPATDSSVSLQSASTATNGDINIGSRPFFSNGQNSLFGFGGAFVNSNTGGAATGYGAGGANGGSQGCGYSNSTSGTAGIVVFEW